MPVLVNCPSCNGPLRVTDELMGRKVRCPACQTIFEAAGPSAPRDDDRQDEDVERVDSWKQLDLEMSRDRDPATATPARRHRRRRRAPRTAAAVARPARGRRTRPGAARASAPPRAADDDRRSDRPRDDRDMRPCPGCRRPFHRDSTRCFSCGERLVTTSRDRDRDPTATPGATSNATTSAAATTTIATTTACRAATASRTGAGPSWCLASSAW